MSDTAMDWFKAKAVESYRQALERGEHDGQCEWRADGFYVCNCSKRAREREGYTTPPGELIHQYPICPRCDEEVEHDGDGFTCSRCKVNWDQGGDAYFYDDHGDLTEDLAKWEARYANTSGQPAAKPRPVETVELPGGVS